MRLLLELNLTEYMQYIGYSQNLIGIDFSRFTLSVHKDTFRTLSNRTLWTLQTSTFWWIGYFRNSFWQNMPCRILQTSTYHYIGMWYLRQYIILSKTCFLIFGIESLVTISLWLESGNRPWLSSQHVTLSAGSAADTDAAAVVPADSAAVGATDAVVFGVSLNW